MLKASVHLLCVITFLIGLSSTALACSCGGTTTEDAYKDALVVFEGEAIDGSAQQCGRKKMLMRVDKVYKGAPEKEVYVHTEDACVGCGKYLNKGQKYMVFARGTEANLNVGGCGATFPIFHDEKYVTPQFLNDQTRQLEDIDTAIASASPQNVLGLLKAKAEHFLYWQDYQRAVLPLRAVLEKDQSNSWAAKELIAAYYKQRKAKEIWDYYEVDQQREYKTRLLEDRTLNNQSPTNLAITFAAITLGKQPINEDRRFVALDITFADLELSDFNFRRLEFRDVIFQKGNFKRADFSRTFGRKAEFIETALDNSVFKRSNLENVRFRQSSLANTDFSGALLDTIIISNSSLTGSRFSGAEIENSRFVDTNADGADFTDAKILRSYFFNANMKNAKLSSVKLDGSTFDCKTIWPDGFDAAAAGATRTAEACAP